MDDFLRAQWRKQQNLWHISERKKLYWKHNVERGVNSERYCDWSELKNVN